MATLDIAEPMAASTGSRPVRVVVFNNMITPYTNRLFNALAEGGLDLAVLSCTREEAPRSWARTIVARYPHRVLAGAALKLGHNRFAHFNIGIPAALERLRPDVLVINGFYPSMLVAALWATWRRMPLALTIDGWQATMPQSLYHRLIRPRVLARCRAIAACGEKGRDFFAAAGIAPDRVFVVPLVPAWRAPTQITPLADRPYHLLWAAQMNEEVKNASFFCDVAAALASRIPGLAVRLVGRGPAEGAMLARLAQAGIRYRHEPHVDWERMEDVYGSARLLALPALLEPWGLVCNEAMQCGTPCVVSPLVGAAGDLVRHGRNGLVLDLDLELWAERIAAVLGEPGQWQALSDRGRADVGARDLSASVAAFRAMIARAVAAG